MKKIVKPAAYLLAAALTAVLAFTNLFYGLDAVITDRLYTSLSSIDDIVIIAVDEETLAEYGKFEDWSREKTAELIDKLWSDEENKPAIVGVDITFVSESDPVNDARLAEASAKGPTVYASNVVYRGKVKEDAAGEKYYDSMNIAAVEEPYPALLANSYSGFSNACISKDGYVRTAMTSIKSEGIDSFAYKIYSLYMQKNGQSVYAPKTNSLSQFKFFFSGKSGEVSHFSMCDVLSGAAPGRLFKNKIVMIGAYAPGMQDAYSVPVNRGTQMYGVEIHANIIQALFEEKTALPMNSMLLGVITFVISIGFLFAASKQKLVPVILESVGIAVLYCIAGRILIGNKIFIPVAYILLFLILSDIYFVIEKYFLERWHRRRTLEVFKKYVAPQVVDDLSKSGDFVLKLGGEKRDVAVLFVDIRGFTPLSESLQPEQVVAILNEYLALTTKSILGHRGTLDKFIGDATMAVFNAPFDQEDYIYEAVCAAWDIKQGSRELGERLYKQFNKTVGFGVGVNCGPAVVGNIGCEFRMDYTAIGDTVNTAARLEANAKAEEILISEYVYDKLKDRITTEEVGEIPLKGKSTKLMVYRVLDIYPPKKNEDPVINEGDKVEG